MLENPRQMRTSPAELPDTNWLPFGEVASAVTAWPPAVYVASGLFLFDPQTLIVPSTLAEINAAPFGLKARPVIVPE